MSNLEQQAQQLVTNGQFDEAIEIYKTIQPCSSHILKLIGKLYVDRTADYQLAIYYFQQALNLEEQNNEDMSDTLTDLGFLYQNLREYELALDCHRRALIIRQQTKSNQSSAILPNLFGIANAYWGQENLSEALKYANQASAINQKVTDGNEINIAMNSAILANIYYHCGDDTHALELAQEALILLEHCTSLDSPMLVSILNNVGTIQVSMNMFDEALLNFTRALHICDKDLSKNNPKRINLESNIQKVREMQAQGYNHLYKYSPLWQILMKFLL